jgi:hypothetical protein
MDAVRVNDIGGEMTTETLKPCPFCGGDAELDRQRSFSNFENGRLERQVVIYCLGCDAEISVCHKDGNGAVSDMAAEITARWNRRSANARLVAALERVAHVAELQGADMDEGGAVADARALLLEIGGGPDCGNCHACLAGKRDADGFPLAARRMILCPKCGNKRCPKASDHRLSCTNSNEPGQPGSVYTRTGPPQ